MQVGEEVKLRGVGDVVVTDPYGTETTYNAGDGRTVTLTPESAGEWSYVWEDGTSGSFDVDAGAPMAAAPMMLQVDAPSVMPRGMSVATFKQYLDKVGDESDVLLEGMLLGAAEFAQNYTGRQLVPIPTSDSQAAVPIASRENLRMRVAVPDARSITSITVNGVATTGYETYKSPAKTIIWVGLPYTAPTIPTNNAFRTVLPEVIITGKFGFDPVPSDLAHAVYLHAANQWYSRAAVYAENVQLTGDGGIANYAWTMPSEVRAVYDNYARGPEVG